MPRRIKKIKVFKAFLKKGSFRYYGDIKHRICTATYRHKIKCLELKKYWACLAHEKVEKEFDLREVDEKYFYYWRKH